MSLKIKEMGPRDGLQNIKDSISTEKKVELIKLLVDAGLDYIEIGAFVSPKAVPQMSDTQAVINTIRKYTQGIETSVLVPNLKGLDLAIESGMQEIAIFTAASETFNQKNINASIEQSFERFKPVCEQALSHKIKIRAYVSTAFVCPYEGDIDPNKVVPIIERLLNMGCYEVSIGDTIGKASPRQMKALYKLTAALGINQHLAGHYHDTYGLALCNVYESLQQGIHTFDTSIGGLGGCPYAPGAKGNLATETLVYFCERENLAISQNIKNLHKVINFINKNIPA
ncbi:MAG TPA: hydroxymethylglutaryl-CoA lyase [Oligoflexia bacterium]|nr:hydroxymethylglutaryl-CoA lyase [Oligoflexia bacterium]HMR23984.1 hydroxymethylglutaryl-CoA lyase [Oligoflexia bacterium]